MIDPATTNGTGEGPSQIERESASSRERRLRKARRFLRTSRAQFEGKHEDAYNVLGEAINLAQALAALWRGILSMKDADEREAAIDGAKCILSVVALNFEDAESQVDRARVANARLKPVARSAMNGGDAR